MIAEYDSSGVLEAEYVRGDNIDEVLTMERGGSIYYYHQDGLGSVTELTDSSGSVVENYTYDPYGNITSSLSSVGNPYYFTGRRLDPESGIMDYRNRNYNMYLGRFMQRDPWGYWDSMNLYEYVWSNPINLVDPYGLGQFGERPLKNSPWLKPGGGGGNGGIFDKGNMRPFHEHYWGDDGWNVGYGPEGTFPEKKSRRKDYKFYGPEYDDDRMKRAYDNLKDRPENQGNKYDLCFINQNNCQDFADRLRDEYERLKEEESKCGGKNK